MPNTRQAKVTLSAFSPVACVVVSFSLPETASSVIVGVPSVSSFLLQLPNDNLDKILRLHSDSLCFMKNSN